MTKIMDIILGKNTTPMAGDEIKVEDGEYIKEKKEYWMPVHISYESKSGGTNGVDLFNAWYKFNTKEWVFKN